jgi:hypothetical protein
MERFIEVRILQAVKEILSGRVNELLEELEFDVPLLEFGEYSGSNVIVPVVTLVSCERTEKERIIRLDSYTVSISLQLSESYDSDLYCFAYTHCIVFALTENPSLGGVVERAVICSKKYIPPKKLNCGEGWEVVITLRVTVEG